jgi:hypothetical protein
MTQPPPRIREHGDLEEAGRRSSCRRPRPVEPDGAFWSILTQPRLARQTEHGRMYARSESGQPEVPSITTVLSPRGGRTTVFMQKAPAGGTGRGLLVDLPCAILGSRR